MSWKKVKLGKILVESKFESNKADPDKRITVRLNLKGVEKRPFEAGVEGGTKYYVRKAGQFIYGKQNLFKGAFGIVPKELDGFESSQDIPAFDVIKDCLPEWIFYYFKQNDFYKSLESLATGTGSRRIQPAKLFDVEIPLPDVEEQESIIANVTKREGNFDLLFKEIDQQQSYLQLLRQTILKEAVQGKLTKQNANDEPANELLKRIKGEKQKLIKEGKLKKEKELPPITEDEIPFELPKGWVWCRLGEICSLVTSGSRSWKNFYSKTGAIFIRSQNIRNGILDLMDKAFVNLPSKTEGIRTSVNVDDILVTITGGNVGKSAFVEQENIGEAYVSQHVALIRLIQRAVAKYISMIIKTEGNGSGQLHKAIYGDKPGLNLTQIRSLVVAFPPLREQQRIITKVGELQQQLDTLETQVQQSRQYAQQLLQAVLKEAFEVNKKEYATNEQLAMAAEDE